MSGPLPIRGGTKPGPSSRGGGTLGQLVSTQLMANYIHPSGCWRLRVERKMREEETDGPLPEVHILQEMVLVMRVLDSLCMNGENTPGRRLK